MDNIGTIIETAAMMAGIIDPTQSMDDKQKLIGLDALNSMLAGWLTDGIPIYHPEYLSFFTIPNKNPLVISSDPTILPDILSPFPILKITKAFYRIFQDDEQLEIMSYQDYDDLDDKSWVQGDYPQALYFEQDLTSIVGTGNLFIYQIPSMISQIFMRVIYNYQFVPNAPVDVYATNIPSEFVEAYKYGLALRFGDMNPGVTFSPQFLQIAAQAKSKLFRLVPPFAKPKTLIPWRQRRG